MEKEEESLTESLTAKQNYTTKSKLSSQTKLVIYNNNNNNDLLVVLLRGGSSPTNYKRLQD